MGVMASQARVQLAYHVSVKTMPAPVAAARAAGLWAFSRSASVRRIGFIVSRGGDRRAARSVRRASVSLGALRTAHSIAQELAEPRIERLVAEKAKHVRDGEAHFHFG